MSDAPDELAQIETDTPPKKGKKGLIIIVILLLLIGGGGAGAYFTGMLDEFIGGEASEEESTEEKSEEEEDGENGPPAADAPGASHFLELPQIYANLSSGSGTSYAKVTAQLEVSDEALLEKLQQKQPKIQDLMVTYIRELRPSDLKGSAGLYRLREELLLRINKVMYPDKINNILFTELLVQ